MITVSQFIATILGLFGCAFAIRVVNDADKHAKERNGLRKYVEEWTEVLNGSRENI
jgi:hypothetical protein